MNQLRFRVIPVSYQDATKHDKADVEFYVETDYWNDYGYCTTYHLHASKLLTGNKTTYLGAMNIMKVGQTTNDVNLLGQIFSPTGGVFSELPEDYFMVSFSLELFKGISLLLKTRDERMLFMKSLNVMFDSSHPLYDTVKDQGCFTESILRNNSTLESFVQKKAKQIMFDEAVFYDLEQQTVEVTYQNSETPIRLDFKCPHGVTGIDSIPYGMVAFIGHNGCGKSSLLYDLVSLIYTPPTQRFIMKDVIKMEPSDVGINKLMMFSYSVFDNFRFPGNTLSDYRLMAEGVDSRQGRFIYCGIRDVKQEMEILINNHIATAPDPNQKNNNTIVQEKRVNEVKLKTVQRLAEEFSAALNVVSTNYELREEWNAMAERCEKVLPSLYQDFRHFSGTSLVWDSDNRIEYYMNMSTGVKFFLHIMSHIYAYNEDNSILLFDEPENHLHPPMLSFMMNEIRRAMRNTHSIMLVATHSPVILQELFAKNIYVINRDGGTLSFRHPLTETYGENFGYINRIVFGLNSEVSDYHKVFSKIYNQNNCKEIESTEDVIRLFHEKLECQQLSSQMVAYIANIHEERKEV